MGSPVSFLSLLVVHCAIINYWQQTINAAHSNWVLNLTIRCTLYAKKKEIGAALKESCWCHPLDAQRTVDISVPCSVWWIDVCLPPFWKCQSLWILKVFGGRHTIDHDVFQKLSWSRDDDASCCHHCITTALNKMKFSYLIGVVWL